MTEGQVTVVQNQLQVAEELNVADVVRRVQKVQAIRNEVMKENVHYGKIPGTDKDTLYKAGAETLLMTFRLSPKYTHTETWKDDHYTVLSRCDLYHIGTGNFVGSGEGMCSTMEAKYRFRLGAPELTDKAVPKTYWDLKKANKMKEAQDLIGGKGFVTVKNDEGRWMIGKKSTSKVDNPDIADTYNTVLKMANKRAKVDAAITALAVSDMFTQDLEEGFEDDTPRATGSPKSANPSPEPPAQGEPVPKAQKEAPKSGFQVRVETELAELSAKGLGAFPAGWKAMRERIAKAVGEESQNMGLAINLAQEAFDALGGEPSEIS